MTLWSGVAEFNDLKENSNTSGWGFVVVFWGQ
jgi:hypothetical protein